MIRPYTYSTLWRARIAGFAKARLVIFAAVVVICSSACTPIPYLPPDPPADERTVLAPPPSPAPEAPATTDAESEPARVVQSLQPAQNANPRVLVLRSGDAENYQDVATALMSYREDQYVLHEVDLSDANGRETALQLGSLVWDAAVAIGEEAAEFAASEYEIATVFCQIFDYGLLIEANDHLYGVEPLPPLELQLETWKQIAPEATTLGIIVTEREAGFVEQAREVAANLGIELHATYAITDQDAVYQFKRFAQTVDGLWLYPNGEILSPTSIREILDYATGHQVQTIVFNRALLDWGALLSVGSDAADVAAQVTKVLDALVAGDGGAIERMAPLSTVDIHVNEETARRLGVANSATIATKPKLASALENDS
jgi:hypothetical protein